MVRYAFTMIELIFALVIMGIVFVTLPLILINDSSHVEQNLMQEAIFASSTKMGQILTYPWDDSNIDPVYALSASNVVNVTSGTVFLDRNNTTDFRIGHFDKSLHRRMTPNSAQRNATAIGTDGDLIFDDIDDFNNATETTLISSTSSQGYKKTYRVKTTVMYVNDLSFIAGDYTNSTINYYFEDNTTGVLPTTNIKMIQVATEQNNTNTNTWEPILVLRSYSSNIGETDLYKRTY